MRAFLAIDLPANIHAALAERQAEFRRLTSSARWTRPEVIHLTLKFLGEITESQAGQVRRALNALRPTQPFSVEIKGFGFFPDARRPRVFWAGVVAPPDLAQLARRVEEAMEEIGFPPEPRPFSPHLTLARFREPRPESALLAAAERHATASMGRCDVREFHLYESKLKPQGAEYIKLARFPLG